jgi:hypothetical protein
VEEIMQTISIPPTNAFGLSQKSPRKFPAPEKLDGPCVTTQQLTPNQFVPLELEKRQVVPTDVAAIHLNRAKQTLLVWATATYRDPPITPIRINGRLAWPVAGIKKLLGMQA